MYFSSQNIPELKGLKFSQRMQVIRSATEQVATPQKLLLNLLKLVILVPLFLLIAQWDSWQSGIIVLILLACYPLLTRPLTFALCRPYLQQSRTKLKF
jgi:ABC-type transport system involved in cytochrome c biogenesis permease component